MAETWGSDKDTYVTQANGKRALAVASGGIPLDVMLTDQTSDIINFKFFQEENETALSADTEIGDREFSVLDATGISEGKNIHIVDSVNQRGMVCEVTGVSGTDISIDRPLDFSYPSGAVIVISSTDMAVDGSTTEQIFRFRLTNYDVPDYFDITKIRFICITAGPVDLSLFGDLTALTNGITIRKKYSDGSYRNQVTFKSNAEMAGRFGNWTPFAATNPAQGVDGFLAEWNCAGQHEQGVALRVGPEIDLEIVLSDGLEGLTIFAAYGIGHLVED